MKIPICRCKGWTTVRPWRHHARGKFQPFGYFPGRELARNRHCCYFWWRQPCTCIPRPSLSRYISPQIEWTVVGIDERWRDGVSPSLRSSRNDRIMHGFQSHETSPFLFFWPGSQQTAYIHQLCQVIRVVIGYQQGFAQDGLTFSPRNVGM